MGDSRGPSEQHRWEPQISGIPISKFGTHDALTAKLAAMTADRDWLREALENQLRQAQDDYASIDNLGREVSRLREALDTIKKLTYDQPEGLFPEEATILHDIASAALTRPMSEPMADRERVPEVRCTMCATEFTAAEIERANECPACGDRGVPCAVADDVTIKVNWHEMRILGIWAENYAAAKAEHPSMQRTVAAICGRIRAQHPDKTPLTMSGELAELRQAFPDNDIEVRGFSEAEEVKRGVEGRAQDERLGARSRGGDAGRRRRPAALGDPD